MTDLKPLRSSSQDQLVLALLESTERDLPRPDSMTRAAAALGVSASALGVAGSATAAGMGATTATMIAKFLLVGAVSGLVVTAGTAHVWRGRPVPPPSISAAAVSATSTPGRELSRADSTVHSSRAREPAALPTRATPPPVVGPEQPEQTAPPEAKRPPAVAAFEPNFERSPVPAVTGSALAQASRLAEEVAMLDRARSALALGRAHEALAVLDGYERQWPAGLLAAEALVVRVEALVRIGEREAASRRARSLLEAQPDSRYAARLRALLAESQPE